MKEFHPFFTIGTLGIIVTALLHIFLALGLSLTSVHVAFFVIYPMYLSFLVIGFGLTLKNQKKPETAKIDL